MCLIYLPQDSKPDEHKVERSIKICELLMRNGCNVNGKNDAGMTPVMVALCQVCRDTTVCA